MKHLWQKDACYVPTESDETQQKHQGDDFMLEQRIKRLKTLAPKGKGSEKTWQRLSRNVDVADFIVKNGMPLLKMGDHESVRLTKIELEIITWRAHLRNSRYLHTKGNLVHNIIEKC